VTIFDLLLIFAFVGCVLGLLYLLYTLIRRQWVRARRVLLALAIFLVLYSAVLLGVSLLSPQRVLAMHQDRCFDDWCLSVERVVRQPTVGTSPTVATARGQFYLVTVQVSSRARGISQRALDAQIYLLDARGQRYDPSPMGQRVLDTAGQGGQPLNSEIAPGGLFTRTVVFDLPPGASHLALVVTHGLFPDVLVIGSEQSFLHKPTIIQLQTDA
jgi:hypothetical protein